MANTTLSHQFKKASFLFVWCIYYFTWISTYLHVTAHIHMWGARGPAVCLTQLLSTLLFETEYFSLDHIYLARLLGLWAPISLVHLHRIKFTEICCCKNLAFIWRSEDLNIVSQAYTAGTLLTSQTSQPTDGIFTV